MHSSSEKFASAHLSVANQFNELAKEVGAYHSAQKDQYRLVRDSRLLQSVCVFVLFFVLFVLFFTFWELGVCALA